MSFLLAMKLLRPLALAALAAALLGYRAIPVHQRDAARAAATDLSARLADAEASNAAMRDAVAAQNSAVAQLKARLAQSADLAVARERAAAAAGDAAVRQAASAARVLEQARTGTGCDAAIRWGNAQGPELARW